MKRPLNGYGEISRLSVNFKVMPGGGAHHLPPG
jgi:hypothetical protein